MMMKRLLERLEKSGVDFEMIHHQTDYRAWATARDTRTSPDAFAKTVALDVDGESALAVLPANRAIATARFARSIGADHVRLLDESEMAERFPDVEVGAVPPFGSLYGVPVYACPLLAEDDRITFNAGTHQDAVRLAWSDYLKLEAPEVVPMSRHEEERVG